MTRFSTARVCGSREDERKTTIGGRQVRFARKPWVQHPDHVPVRRTPVLVEDNEPKAKATVARGRTVHAPIPGAYEAIGFDPTTAEPLRVLRHRAYGPGETIEAPVAEIERLKRLGFLHDPARYATDEEAAALPPQPEPPAADT